MSAKSPGCIWVRLLPRECEAPRLRGSSRGRTGVAVKPRSRFRFRAARLAEPGQALADPRLPGRAGAGQDMLRLGVAGSGLVRPSGIAREVTERRQRVGFAAGGARL